MTREDCILLGTIAKTHGVRGELIIRTAGNSFDLEQDWESIFLQIDGILVPFFISALRPLKSDEWVVRFDWYEDKTRAEKLCGLSVWIQKELMPLPDEEISLYDLIGFSFTDKTSGKSGQIADFVDIPDNPVFEVELDGSKILIPAREELILGFDTKSRVITFELPEDLV